MIRKTPPQTPAPGAAPTQPRAATRAAGRKSRSRTGRGTLFIIAALLVGSAVMRIGDDAGRAIAKQMSQSAQTHDGNGADHGTTSHLPTEGCTPPADIAGMLTAFKEREKRLSEREAQMQSRLKALELVDRKISERMAELKSAEEDLRKTLSLADSAAEKDIARLTSVYQSMKPKDAAALFEQMDPTFSAGFLGRMEPGAAAQIMAGLSPTTAYTISAILAGRNADVPTE